MKKSNNNERFTNYNVTKHSTLLDFLINQIPGSNRTKAKKMLAMKMVYINQVLTTQFDTLLMPGQVVQISQKGNPHALTSKYVRIVYEDEFIIVIDKIEGIVSVPMPGTREMSVKDILNDYVKRKNKRFSVHTVHRLDRGTSGLLIFAKRRNIQQELVNHWHDYIFDRRYIAVVEGEMEEQKGTVTSWLSENQRYVIRSSPIDNGGKYAVTHFATRKANQSFSLVELKLETGRTNQIRVHMSELKHPVAGDEKYGAKKDNVKRLCLHAYKLQFYHPVTKQLMKFETKVPDYFLALTK